MKAKFVNFRKSNLFYTICLMTVLVPYLFACAGLLPGGQTKPADVSKPSSDAPAADSSSSPSTVSGQTEASDAEPATQVREEKPAVHLVLIYRAYLRAEPHSKSKITAKLKKGEKVVKVGVSGSWVQIELSDKTTGWVLKKQVQEAK